MKNSSQIGVLVKWGPDRGYGFVVTPDGREIFAHVSAVLDLEKAGPLEIGQVLRFSVIKDKGKFRVVRAVRTRMSAMELKGV